MSVFQSTSSLQVLYMEVPRYVKGDPVDQGSFRSVIYTSPTYYT